MDERFQSKEVKRQKLRELLKNRERGFKARLAKYCGVDQRTPYNWTKEGGAWPTGETEERLWDFFRHHQHEEQPLQRKEQTHSEKPVDVGMLLKQLFDTEATDPDARQRLAAMKALVQHQLEVFLRLTREGNV